MISWTVSGGPTPGPSPLSELGQRRSGMTTADHPDLSDRRVVVAGASGAIGEGVTKSYLEAGAQVVALSRSTDSAERLKGYIGEELGGRLSVVVADYTSIAGAAEVARDVRREHGPVDDVVASVGGWWEGPRLWETSEEEWRRVFTDLATAHFALARAWTPSLPSSGSYQLIIGASGVYPVEGSGIVSMQQAALLMMGDVLASEAPDKRVFSHVLGAVNNRRRRGGRPEWIDVSDVGTLAVFVSAHRQVDSRRLPQLDKAEFDMTFEDVTEDAEDVAS